MNAKKIITRNVLWNLAGLATRMLVGFFVAPFLLHRLGDSTYGLWIVIGSLTSYFSVLDLGVRGSVGRNVALFRARGDVAGINAIFSTAFCYLCAVAVLSLAATFGAMYAFFFVIQVEPDHADTARLALLLVGFSFALSLPLQAFDGILWAYQRFDLQNGVDIPTVLLRAGLTYWVVGAGHGLVALAVITLFTSLAGLAVKAWMALRLEPDLRIGWARIDRAATTGLFGYGLWYFLLSLVRTIAPPISLMIVGSRLGMTLVAPFNVATGLIGYANQFLIAGTQVLTPVATALHARDDQERQRALFVTGGRGCLALTLLLVSLFVFLGRPLIRLWMGPSMEYAFPLLLILSAGELLPMSQWITYSMILGKGRHRILAICSLLEIAVSAGAALLLTAAGGSLTAVCAAIALPGAVGRGVVPLLFGCRLVGIAPAQYLGRALLPAVAGCRGSCAAAWPGDRLVDAGLLARAVRVRHRLLGRSPDRGRRRAVRRRCLRARPGAMRSLCGPIKLVAAAGFDFGGTAMKRLRVVHVTGCLDLGGQEKLLVEFAKHADRDRFDLHFVSLSTRGTLADELEAHGWPVETLGLSTGLHPRLPWKLAKLLQTWGADIVHTHNERPLIYAAPAARLARVPRVIHTKHGRAVGNTRRQNMLIGLTARLVDRFVCVSDDCAELAIEQGVPAARVLALRNGIDTQQFAFAGPCPDGPAVIVARLCPEKDHATLLHAVSIVIRDAPDFRLQIAGAGPALTDLRQLAEELHLTDHVQFLGVVRDVPAILEQARVYVLSSSSEGISLTLLEAMARGLPVVATRVGGTPEVVADGVNGLLVPPRDPAALAAALLRLHRDAEFARRMGSAGRRQVEQRFDIRRMIARYERLYLGLPDSPR